jgi:sugar phosphate isomerase/epimerase
MENGSVKNSRVSRRKFLGSTAAAATLAIVPVNYAMGSTPKTAPGDKPNSNFNGVNVGAITYSWRSMPSGAENILKYCLETGISTIELMSGDVEEYLGAPANPMTAIFNAMRAQQAPPAPPQSGQTAPPAAAAPPQRPQMTPEQQALIAKYNEDMKAWRLALPMSAVEKVRKLFNDAGVDIHIVKFSPAQWSDGEIDYAFKAAKALGAKGVSDEISEAAVNKLGPIAEKHGMFAVFHQHMQFATAGFSYDPFFAVSPAVKVNFDAGHFFGSTGIHPNTIIEKYHDRIFSIHIKDKTGPNANPANTNQVWGQGEMPLADVLLLIKKQKWPIYCDIELEYEVKPWSNAVKEVKTCLNYAKAILLNS